jgi:GT2 family glycosyltransferase
MTYRPGISIVIPTEGRAQLTCHLVQRLDVLRRKVEFSTEVLVVDSSQGSDCRAIAEACAHSRAEWIEGPASVRKKRNMGIAKACYSVVLFLDSDCKPREDLLEQHWRAYQRQDAPCLGGVLGGLEFTGPETFAWNLVKNSSLVQQFNQFTVSYVKWGPTANLSIRQEALDAVGPFDETFPFKLGGDDLDLTYRLTNSGWLLLRCPDALVYHDRSTWSSWKAVLSRALRWGRMEYFLYKKHPSLQTLHPPSFFGWLILVSLFSAASAVILQTWRFLALPLGWIGFSIMLFSLWIYFTQEGSRREKGIAFRESLLSSIPELVYQLGSTFEFLRHGDLRFLYSRPLLSPDGITGIWAGEAWNTWSNLLAFYICYLAAAYWVRFA